MNQLEKMVWSAAFSRAWSGAWLAVAQRRGAGRPEEKDLGDNWAREQAVKSADKVVLDLRKHLEANGGRLHHSDELEAERLEEEL